MDFVHVCSRHINVEQPEVVGVFAKSHLFFSVEYLFQVTNRSICPHPDWERSIRRRQGRIVYRWLGRLAPLLRN